MSINSKIRIINLIHPTLIEPAISTITSRSSNLWVSYQSNRLKGLVHPSHTADEPTSTITSRSSNLWASYQEQRNSSHPINSITYRDSQANNTGTRQRLYSNHRQRSQECPTFIEHSLQASPFPIIVNPTSFQPTTTNSYVIHPTTAATRTCNNNSNTSRPVPHATTTRIHTSTSNQ